MSRFAAVYLTAVIETVVHDLLKSSVELAVEAGATEIGNRCLLQAVNDNVDLKNLFGQCIILGAGHPQESIDPFVAGSAEEPVDPSRFCPNPLPLPPFSSLTNCVSCVVLDTSEAMCTLFTFDAIGL